MKALKALLFVATAMLCSGTSWAMEGKVAVSASTTSAATAPMISTAIVAYNAMAVNTPGMELKHPEAQQATRIDAKNIQAIQAEGQQTNGKSQQSATPSTLRLVKLLGLDIFDATTATLLVLSSAGLGYILSEDMVEQLRASDKASIKTILIPTTSGSAALLSLGFLLGSQPFDQKYSETADLKKSIKFACTSATTDILKTAKTGLSIALFIILRHLSHECGHAVMAVLCGADPQHINIFLFSDSNVDRITYSDRGDPYYIQPLVRLSFINSYLDSMSGYAEVWVDLIPNKINKLLIYTAGGCAGLLSLYALLATQAFAQEYTNSKSLKKAAMFAITHAHTPYQNILEQKGLNAWQLFLRLSINAFILTEMLNQACYAFLPNTSFLTGDGSSAWMTLLDCNRNTFVTNNNIQTLHTIRENILTIGGYLILIKSINCWISYRYGRPLISHNMLWEKILKPQIDALAFERRIINDFVYQRVTDTINLTTNPEHYALHPKAKTSLFMQAIIHCLHNKVLAPAGNRLQQAGSWTKQKGSQAWSTIKGWFNCRKPKMA